MVIILNNIDYIKKFFKKIGMKVKVNYEEKFNYLIIESPVINLIEDFLKENEIYQIRKGFEDNTLIIYDELDKIVYNLKNLKK